MLTRRTFVTVAGAGFAAACSPAGRGGPSPVSWPDHLVAFDGRFGDIVGSDAVIEELGSGYQWAEGPAWDAERQTLYFTDVPANVAYSWNEQRGVREFLNPSSGTTPGEDGFREQGANGLLMAKDGSLLMCNHGARNLQAYDLASGQRTVLADRFQGKRFNSPNDVIAHSDGRLFFTDPPYGLEGLNDSPLKELKANGVYVRAVDGTVTRMLDDMTFPNGVALSPDEKYLYIAQSDPEAALVRRVALDGSSDDRKWFDATPFMDGFPGLPDGIAVSTDGYLCVAGPGGVLVIDPEGVCLGRILTGSATANCAFGEDGRTLFMTAQDRLLKVKTRMQGLGTF